MTRIAYLGPDGTFASEAARRASHKPATLVPLPGIAEVVAAVRAGDVDRGVVPIENSVEGTVNVTLDELAFGSPDVHIRGELTLPIRLHLLGRPGTGLDALRTVRSHPHALAQTRRWLATHLPDATQEASASTAEAARQAGAVPDVAAVAAPTAATRFGLSVLAADIGDHIDNTTRFVVLAARFAPPTGADRTSLVVFFGNDRPGQLLRVLNEFASRGINLSKIESRPTKKQLGEYCIFLDCAGHLTEPRVAEALRGVHRHVAEVRVLGSYPRADGRVEQADASDSAAAYAESADWLARVTRLVDGG